MRTMALPMRRALTPAIVLFWLVMVCLLVHEQAPPSSATSDGRRLTVTYGAHGGSSQASILLTQPIYRPATLRARALAAATTPGTTYTVPVSNPLALRNEPLTVKVDGRAALDGVDAI